MDSLYALLQKATERWHELSPKARWLVVGITSLTMVAVLYPAGRRIMPQSEWLLSGRSFSQRELTNIEAALAKAGLDDYEVKEDRVWIPRERRSDYIAALVDGAALPAGFDVGLKEEAHYTNPFESPEQRRARMQLAHQRNLAMILRAMNGIEEATVQFDEETSGSFRRDRRVTALVAIRPESNATLDPRRIESIRQLVASSRLGLSATGVTVTDLNTGRSHSGDVDESRLNEFSDYATHKELYERQWEDKVRAVLQFISGVQVATNVELARTPVPSATSRTGHGYREADLDIETHDPHVRHIWMPSLVAISVGVPHAFYRSLRSNRSDPLSLVDGTKEAGLAPKSLEQLEFETNHRINGLVKNLFSEAVIRDGVVQIHVTTIPDAMRLVGTNVAMDHWLAQRSRLLIMAIMIVAGVAVLISFVGLRRDAALIRHKELPAEFTSRDELHAEQPPIASESTPMSFTQRKDGPNLRVHHELTRIVREDPQTAAALLKEWLRKAG